MASALSRLCGRRPARFLAAAGVLALSLIACSSEETASLGDETQVFRVDLGDRSLHRLSDGGSFVTSPTWSPDGTELAYVTGGSDGTEVVIVNADGDDRRTVFRDRLYQARALDWSPGGGTIALAAVADETAVTVGFVTTDSSLTRWVDSYRNDRSIGAPTWSPDGTRLAYARPWGSFRLTRQSGGRPAAPSVDARPIRVVVAASAGGGPHVVPVEGETSDPQWSPDGRSLLFTRAVGRSSQLVVVPTVGATATTTAVSGSLTDGRAAWAPNSRRIAFAGVSQSGDRRYHLYLVTADGQGDARQVLGDAVATLRPAWSPDGGQLAFADDKGRIRAVRLRSGRTRVLVDVPGAEFGEIVWSPTGRSIAFTARRQPPAD
jgi:TolB protein